MRPHQQAAPELRCSGQRAQLVADTRASERLSASSLGVSYQLVPACKVVADTDYDSDALYGLIAASGAVAVIPPTPRRRNMPHFDPTVYAKRHHIEQTFSLKQYRRLATHYDKLDACFEAFRCGRIFTLYLNYEHALGQFAKAAGQRN